MVSIMLRVLRNLAALLLLGGGLACPAVAEPGSGATASGEVSAEIVTPLTVRAESALQFGTIVAASGSVGTVTVQPIGAPVYGGGVRGLCSGGNCGAEPAHFVLQGEPGRHFRVELPSQLYAYGSTGGSPPLSVVALSFAGANGGIELLLDSQGGGAFFVGGTLVVPADTPSDNYRATVPVTVAYD